MKTILLIDDDQLCRAPAAEVLREWDWKVIEAGDGEHGLELALEHRPDVILCDLLMPRRNGFQLCRAVREHIELKHTRIIVVSGRDYAADRQSAEDAGADEYLVKPLDEGKLRDAIGRVAPRAGARPAQPPPDDAPSPLGEAATVVRFWGVRGSIPTPGPSTVVFGGNTSCVEVRADGELIVLDAGTGIRPLGLALAQEFGEQPIALTLLISHTHWDHIQGFPFFLPAYHAKNRLRILGYEGAAADLAATLAGQMESPYFPIALKQMPGNIVIEELREMEFRVGPVRVQASFSNHPGVCVGYRLFTSGGSIVYLPDNEWSAAEKEDGSVVPCTFERTMMEFVRGADVLIIDAQYDKSEYHAHVGWGHGCVDDVVRLAIEAQVKQLFLFHHDPSHDDRFIERMAADAQQLARAAGSALRVEAAREGAEVRLARRPAMAVAS